MKSIVIAGANGFIGKALTKNLSREYHIIALTRNVPSEQSKIDNVEFRQCDLFSLLDTEKALEGADYAIYLVHSMMPSARLTQGNFQDTDLILADNFVRAAEKKKVEQILYLGGIIPEGKKLSSHLESRLEVEETLASGSVPITAFRTSLIVGPGGSSFDMMKKLVSRLPIMICPKWTRSKTQPVSLEDVLVVFDNSVGNPEFYDKRLDIAGPDIVTYQEMMKITANCLGKSRWIFTVPVFSTRLSVLWVSLFSETPHQLVAPLVESLRHDMVAKPNSLVTKMKLPNIPFRQSVEDAVNFDKNKVRLENNVPRKKNDAEKKVRSVQRLILPRGKDAAWVARTYPDWLAKSLRTFLIVKTEPTGNCKFYFRFWKRALLELTFSEERSHSKRSLFYITGGILAKTTKRSRLEFRQVLGNRYVLVAIHDYEPTLPWYIYNLSQALAHLWVMHRFGRYLEVLNQKEV